MRHPRRAIASASIESVAADDRSPRAVGDEFRRLLDSGYRLRVDGEGRSDPLALLGRGYTPKYSLELFGTRYFVANQRIGHELRVMPAFVLPAADAPGPAKTIHARVFYKDSSLVWRVASHYINTPHEQWIGKGAVKRLHKHGRTQWVSAEETTNLPFELQAALDDISRRGPAPRTDNRVLHLVLRNAPSHRVWPYRDFEAPRERAMAFARNRINGGRSISWFDDDRNPRTLRFEPGFEPDFDAVIDSSYARSTMYGGDIAKHRVASANGRIQYLFVAGPRHVWIVHPQAFTVELSSYGVRTVDVIADEDMCIPGYEFFDNHGSGEIDDQIPEGFAGEICPYDPDRADASPWNERMPVIRAFRRSRLARA